MRDVRWIITRHFASNGCIQHTSTTPTFYTPLASGCTCDYKRNTHTQYLTYYTYYVYSLVSNPEGMREKHDHALRRIWTHRSLGWIRWKDFPNTICVCVAFVCAIRAAHVNCTRIYKKYICIYWTVVSTPIFTSLMVEDYREFTNVIVIRNT